MWSGLTLATLRYGLDRTWAMVGFGLLSAYIQLPLLVLRSTPRDRRRHGRERQVPVTVPRPRTSGRPA